MDKTIVERSKGSQILETIIGGVATAVCAAIVYVALAGEVTADLVLWSGGFIVVAAVGGMLFYIVAAIAGATEGY
jgi:hypothetical protein